MTGLHNQSEFGDYGSAQGSLKSLQVTYYLLLIRQLSTNESDPDSTWKLGLRVHTNPERLWVDTIGSMLIWK